MSNTLSPSIQATQQADRFFKKLSEDIHLDEKLLEKYRALFVLSILYVIVDVKADEYKRS